MDALVYIAKHYLNRAGRDLVAGYIADRGERRRTGGSSDRMHFNKLSVRMQRLNINGRAFEFHDIDRIGAIGAIRHAGNVAATMGAPGIEKQYHYEMALYNVEKKIPEGERSRFIRSGNIYSIIESILYGKIAKDPEGFDNNQLRGVFILTKDLSLVKEVVVYGQLYGAQYSYEIVSFELDRHLQYKVHFGLHARFFWLAATRISGAGRQMSIIS